MMKYCVCIKNISFYDYLDRNNSNRTCMYDKLYDVTCEFIKKMNRNFTLKKIFMNLIVVKDKDGNLCIPGKDPISGKRKDIERWPENVYQYMSGENANGKMIQPDENGNVKLPKPDEFLPIESGYDKLDDVKGKLDSCGYIILFFDY